MQIPIFGVYPSPSLDPNPNPNRDYCKDLPKENGLELVAPSESSDDDEDDEEEDEEEQDDDDDVGDEDEDSSETSECAGAIHALHVSAAALT